MTTCMKLIRPQRRPYPREGDEDLDMSVSWARDRSIDIVIPRRSIVIPYEVLHRDSPVSEESVAGESELRDIRKK